MQYLNKSNNNLMMEDTMFEKVRDPLSPRKRSALRTLARVSVLGALAFQLSGCLVALPPAIQLASFAADGISYATTGKSVTDHAISAVAERDCAMGRVLTGDDICAAPNPQLAMLPKASGLMATSNLHNIKAAADDQDFRSASVTLGSVPDDVDEIMDSADLDADAPYSEDEFAL